MGLAPRIGLHARALAVTGSSVRLGLEHFKNELLFASLQDKYAPFNSARIELHKVLMRRTLRRWLGV